MRILCASKVREEEVPALVLKCTCCNYCYTADRPPINRKGFQCFNGKVNKSHVYYLINTETIEFN